MRLWIAPAFALLLLCPWIIGASECNAFGGTADKTSDAALMYSAKQQIDQGNYANALTVIGQMTATGRNAHDGRVLEASAHAGLCGLNLLTFASNISAGISSSTLMTLLMQEMKAATSYASCVSAETLLLGISSAQMTSDDWVFLAFVEFAKIGAALEIGGLDSPAHSGTVTANFDTCNTAGALSDTIVADIGLGLAVAINAIAQSGIAIGPSGISAICSAPYNFPCSATSASTISGDTATMKLIRSVIKTNDFSLGTNSCGGSMTSGGNCTPCL